MKKSWNRGYVVLKNLKSPNSSLETFKWLFSLNEKELLTWQQRCVIKSERGFGMGYNNFNDSSLPELVLVEWRLIGWNIYWCYVLPCQYYKSFHSENNLHYFSSKRKCKVKKSFSKNKLREGYFEQSNIYIKFKKKTIRIIKIINK